MRTQYHFEKYLHSVVTIWEDIIPPTTEGICRALCRVYSFHLTDESVCVFVECTTEDEAVKKEVYNNVTVTISKLLPDEIMSEIFPGIAVVSAFFYSQTY